MKRNACRSDWAALPCPEAREWFDLTFPLTPDEARLVEAGFVPQASDDRWFLFVEDWVLYCHRSWTGDCIFGARLEERDIGYSLTDGWVSRDRLVYESDGIANDRQLLLDLVRSHLLEPQARR